MRPARVALLIAVAAVVVVGPPFLPAYYLDLATRILELGIFAMSLDILLGYTGLWSLGHSAFFGFAAYVVGLMSLKLGANPLLASTASLGLTLILAAVFGVVILRSRGVYFMMLSLALAQVVWGIAYDGLPGIPRPNLTALGLDTTRGNGFYLLVVLVFLIATTLMFLITRSPFGQSLAGIRENELRMKTLGYNVWLHQYVAYILAAFFAGWGGILFAYHNGIVSPNDLSVLRSAEALLMVVLGSPGTLFGPIVGAVVVVLLRSLVSIYTERWLAVLGIVYVVTVLFASRGLFNTVLNWRRRST
ncbi:MAG: branched-chain amino acid ABC transporter permease [Chloroflexi bacterium]|nr:branched-chain amino acid ABC transporter permease [Chloroflexota bacterium]